MTTPIQRCSYGVDAYTDAQLGFLQNKIRGRAYMHIDSTHKNHSYIEPEGYYETCFFTNGLVVLLVKAASNPSEASFLSLLVPLLDPNTRANRFRVLLHGLAAVLVRLLSAQQILVVAVPAMERLVHRGESIVARGGADVGNHL